MKPVVEEISKEEYWGVREALARKAIALAEPGEWGKYLAECPAPLARPKQPKRWLKRGVENLLHFLPVPCDRKESLKEKAICLARTIAKDWNYHYYLAEHLPGQCPFKIR